MDKKFRIAMRVFFIIIFMVAILFFFFEKEEITVKDENGAAVTVKMTHFEFFKTRVQNWSSSTNKQISQESEKAHSYISEHRTNFVMATLALALILGLTAIYLIGWLDIKGCIVAGIILWLEFLLWFKSPAIKVINTHIGIVAVFIFASLISRFSPLSWLGDIIKMPFRNIKRYFSAEARRDRERAAYRRRKVLSAKNPPPSPKNQKSNKKGDSLFSFTRFVKVAGIVGMILWCAYDFFYTPETEKNVLKTIIFFTAYFIFISALEATDDTPSSEGWRKRHPNSRSSFSGRFLAMLALKGGTILVGALIIFIISANPPAAGVKTPAMISIGFLAIILANLRLFK